MKPCIFAIISTAITFLFCKETLNAQVCNGSFGDPVVNVTFGNGANPGKQLTPGVTTYNFTNNTCPDDGFYTIVNNSIDCFGNSWHSLSTDHTPNDTNGYMMIVNASFTPGDFYVDTVRDLCAFTTYEFGAWITNVLTPTSWCSSPISPKLVFNIETLSGTVLGTFSTGDIPSSSVATWQQYKFIFTTPLNTSDIVLRLTNSAPGGCGNDLALDDITFRPCGPTVITSLPNTSQSTINLCKGVVSNIPLTAVLGSGFASPSLQWQSSIDSGITWNDIPGATSLSYQYNTSGVGIYKYRLTVAEGTNILLTKCRVNSNPFSVIVHDLPAITASVNSPLCENDTIQLTASGGTSYLWSGPLGFSSTLANPSLIALPNTGGRYTVNGTGNFGCIDSTAINVITSASPFATINTPPAFCEGNSIQLQAGGGSTYSWFPATGLSATNIPNPLASPTDTTNYFVVVSNGNNCTDTAAVTLNVIKKPTANAGPDKFVVRGQPVLLEGNAGGSDISYSWLPSTYLDNPLLLRPTARPLNDMTYTLRVVSEAGCGMATDDLLVTLFQDIYIPSAFSPNNDGLNDTWRINALGALPNSKVTVFNRYGKVIFEATGNSKQWDGTFKGKPQPTGVYTYLVELNNGRPLMKGTVMIVR